MNTETNIKLKALIEDCDYPLSILANMSALLWEEMDNLNWCGFYLMDEGLLKLGPFQGKVACTKIEVGKGVCGTSVYEDKTQRVEDVHKFKGHIACDSASNSEIVIPIHVDNKIYGVLDIDSPLLNRFSVVDQEMLEDSVKILEEKLNSLMKKE